MAGLERAAWPARTTPAGAEGLLFAYKFQKCPKRTNYVDGESVVLGFAVPVGLFGSELASAGFAFDKQDFALEENDKITRTNGDGAFFVWPRSDVHGSIVPAPLDDGVVQFSDFIGRLFLIWRFRCRAGAFAGRLQPCAKNFVFSFS